MNIIIDAGHGGKDPGGGTNKYFKEKDKTLEISLYQYNRFKQIGIPVKLTRDKDMYLSPANRTKIVRESGADICISNHINNVNTKTVEGAETIYSIFSDGRLANMILQELGKEGMKERRAFSKKSTKYIGKDYYYMHRDTGEVQTVIIEYGFASNENDTQKILDHWQEYAEAVVRAVCIYIGYPYEEEEKTKILGVTQITTIQLQEWAKTRNAHQRFIDVAPIYIKYGKLTGIRADILYSQAAYETGFGHYTGKVKPYQNNWAGVKIKNPTGDSTEDFETFKNADDGVRAHFNHMAAYTGVNPVGTPHDRYFVVKSISWAGTIKYAEELGGKWSTVTTYGNTLVENYLKDLIKVSIDILDYKELYNESKEENKILNDRIKGLESKLEQIENIAKAGN